MDEQVKNKIEKLLGENEIMLFMKGDPLGQMCGFSAQVVAILKGHNAEFNHVNVWADHTLWEGIKEYGNWPTIPQLYVKGKLIGGCDIVCELAQSGELKNILNK